MKANSKSKISRRSLLKSGVAATTAAAAGTLGAPMIWAQSNIVLRQSGTGVSAFNEIAAKAKEDLGITMEMTALDSDSVAQKVATQPKSFDIADIEYFTVKKVWGAGNLQPFDVSRLKNYDKIVGIFKNGKLTPTSKIAQGTAPHTVGFADSQDAKTFASSKPTGTPWCPPSTTRTPWGSVLTSSTGLSIPGPNC